MKERNLNLDLVKILACFAVIGIHTLHPELSMLSLALYYSFIFAVPAFLMVSGYVLLQKKEIKFSYVRHKIFVISRIIIIWSAISLLLNLLEDICMHKGIKKYDLFSFPEKIIDSLTCRGDMYHLWYLGALIIIYTILPFLHKFILSASRSQKFNDEKFGRSIVLLLLWNFLAMISVCIQNISLIDGIPLQKNIILTFRLWTWLQYFLYGALMVYAVPKIKEHISLRLHAFLLVFFMAAIVIWQIINGNHLIRELIDVAFFYDDNLVILYMLILFTFIMRLKISGKPKNFIIKFTPLTMGIYIIHPFVITEVLKLVTIDGFSDSVLFFLSVLIISIALSYIISKLPLIKYIIKL